ncbi:DUF3320 domain-containing protein [Tardiphaga sp. 42S5]|uniref:DUF3320 domain-containing protein n=1 Tax=Tardiphaga sp. 42S5 TaxID=1404799 RepID=UPI002A5ADF53|nr:DUF3320 domain-containing protein [Tardiphaga sp. 42S5]WPO43201.1 DUF3320 domain-containing protein [Tardiphaga sp. 42S5]
MPLDHEGSIFQSGLSIESKLERAREELLDLSARNRLLNMPRSSKSAKTIEILDEKTDQIFRLFINEGRTFTFLAGRPDRKVDDENSEESEDVELAQPTDAADVDERGMASRHFDTKFQTRMTPTGLQKRLLDLYHDARTLEEEQGVNILFLALGTLKWIDPNNKDNIRYAPLVLVPVKLERGTAGEKFKLRVRPEELTGNLSLEAYLDRVHKLRLPPFEVDDESLPGPYFEQVAHAISTKPDWSVNPDEMVLGFFSFAKFLMYRDLDPELWPATGKLTDQRIVRALLSDGYPPGLPALSDDDPIDPHITPAEMLHIVDCDSSQTLAVHDVRCGTDLVVQGPPGTGKSQTIANIIASAIVDGKSVLFVAEKMAALDVVKRRLDQAGVGDACLELHSHKANKRAVLDELRRTWELGSPRGESTSEISDRLLVARDDLNSHAERMHQSFRTTGLTPFQVIGQLTRLRREGQGPVELALPQAPFWTPEDLAKCRSILNELAERVDDIGQPSVHPWHGIGLSVVLPTTLERLMPRIEAIAQSTERLQQLVYELAEQLEQTPSRSIEETAPLSRLAATIGAAPSLVPAALTSPVWEQRPTDIIAAIRTGSLLQKSAEELRPHVTESALEAPVRALLESLAWLSTDATADIFEKASIVAQILPQLKDDVARLEAELRTTTPATDIASVARLLTIGERVAVAPDASPEAFIATVWDHGVEQAADLVDAVASLEALRADLGDKVLDIAWSADVASTRQVLATNTGIFRHFSGEWRKARALGRSILRDSNQPETEIVKLLDVLMKAQTALAMVRAGDSFGRSAFGADWRGERSASAPLAAIVAWMRTLRGLGAEPRIIAGNLAERSEVARRTENLRKRLAALRPALSDFWTSLGSRATEAFVDAGGSERIGIDRLQERTAVLVDAEREINQVLINPPIALSERLQRLEAILAWQQLDRQLKAIGPLGQEAFGDAWQGDRSDWLTLARATDWMTKYVALRHLAARVQDRNAARQDGEKLAAATSPLLAGLTNVLEALETTSQRLFGEGPLQAVSIATLTSRLGSWIAAPEQLSKWVSYNTRVDHARKLGLSDFVDHMSDGRLSTQVARSTFDMAYYEAVFSEIVKEQPDIARFDGQLHSKLVSEFANLDKARMASASLQVVREHHRRIPAQGGVGAVGTLRAEMARRRGHMPIRQLVQRAGSAVQALKPVLMMSPLSVAQFLTPGKMTFDLLVMDEASQIQPVDAIGAIARCRQVVIVGDDKQLPPTKFFAKLTGASDENDDDDSAQVADIESILGLFTARGVPQRMLRWHYRSRHQSLIAISNTQFYESKLFIVPSPYTQEAGMGLRFSHVPDGIFDSGGTTANMIEARRVAEAILTHAKQQPKLSLGVATFSVSQRRVIQEEVERLRRLNPETEEFFHSHPSEPFFVKNLENVQGDERDVIMISVGYARGANSPLSMRFGPLGAEGGERRLNVLISRAKRRCEVFASITDEDIDLARAKGKGVFALKLFLQYARTGRLQMSQATTRDPDSVFEEQVAAALQESGYQVHPQVGIAGFFIDLAVADAERPGRYLIGIECDGAAYHDARSARDRDRLRQAVLEDHGWIIHRIWSTDWFQRPREQLQRTIEAIEAAKRELDERLERSDQISRAVPVRIVTVDRGEVTEIGLAEATVETGVPAYIEATPRRPGAYELHETPVGLLAELVERVVSVEAPVHVDEVVARLKSAWSYQRAGGRIQLAVEQAVSLAKSRETIRQDGHFLLAATTVPVLRDRSYAASPGLRRPEMIASAELAAGIKQLVTSSFGATEDEIVQTISRQLGFKATSAQLKTSILQAIQEMQERKELVKDGAMWMPSADTNISSSRHSQLASPHKFAQEST